MLALGRQVQLPTRVILVFKNDDAQTAKAVEQLRAELPILDIHPIVVASNANFRDQLNAGLAATSEEIVAFTDDDAEPSANWIQQLLAHYADPKVAGVGGRDWQPHERWDEPIVGKMSWYGRVVGNHHLGCGPAREVELLKGVNWSFRGDVVRAIGFDSRLRGKATVMQTEMMLCLAVRRSGWKLIYDPAVTVEHHVAQRLDGDVNSRGGFDRDTFIDSVHNEVLAMLTHLHGGRRIVYRVWSGLVGTSGTPGLLQTVRRIIKRKDSVPQAWERYRAVRAAVRLANATLRNHPVASRPISRESE